MASSPISTRLPSTRSSARRSVGAEHLDAATRERQLDYFVLFSSATTFIGNPGQGAYVAANGFMEGLARRRKALGLPALAVAWGAIGDVGVLARNRAVMETLAGRVGVTPMDARRSLDLMAEALEGQGSSTRRCRPGHCLDALGQGARSVSRPCARRATAISVPTSRRNPAP